MKAKRPTSPVVIVYRKMRRVAQSWLAAYALIGMVVGHFLPLWALPIAFVVMFAWAWWWAESLGEALTKGERAAAQELANR